MFELEARCPFSIDPLSPASCIVVSKFVPIRGGRARNSNSIANRIALHVRNHGSETFNEMSLLEFDLANTWVSMSRCVSDKAANPYVLQATSFYGVTYMHRYHTVTKKGTKYQRALFRTLKTM